MSKAKLSRWSPIPRFPLTDALHKCFPKSSKKQSHIRSDLVSEKLCDDILSRLSPFLLRKPAVDILDLWPGAGLWSSKVNQLLNPRRHVLIEPELATYKPLLQPLAESRSCYKLLSMNIQGFNDWESLLAAHFPEQGPSNRDDSGLLPKNDTLLILANPSSNFSKRDHYTPARWCSTFLEACMRQTGFHTYGSVRLIASLPVSDAQQVIPRTIIERKRPALLTENVALHAFEVAAPKDPSVWVNIKGWKFAADIASRVAQRAAEQNISTPPGREVPPLAMAPESPYQGKIPVPYEPRVFTQLHEKLDKKIKASNKLGKADPVRMRALTQLNKDNRDIQVRRELADKLYEIDELTKSLSRSAADPNMDSTALKPILDQIETSRSVVAQIKSDTHYGVIKELNSVFDNRRAALSTGSFDDAVLLWDRRPFEPLFIEPEETYPREYDRSIIYFEPDPNPIPLRKIQQLGPSQRNDPFRLFEAYSLTLHTRNQMTVPEFLEIIFPGRSTDDILKAIPSLAAMANKAPKPDFDNLPKTLHGPPDAANSGKNLDPATCYQENLDYDLSDVRARTLTCSILWDIFVEYQKGDTDLSAVQLSRALGATLTSFRSGEHNMPEKRYH